MTTLLQGLSLLHRLGREGFLHAQVAVVQVGMLPSPAWSQSFGAWGGVCTKLQAVLISTFCCFLEYIFLETGVMGVLDAHASAGRRWRTTADMLIAVTCQVVAVPSLHAWF